MNKNEPQVSENGRGVSGRPEGGEESDGWPEASSNPAIKQRACVSCCKNCVVHRLDVESGLRPGSDPQRTADQWDRTDSELQHQDNSWDRNNREPQPTYTYEPKYKLLANTIDHDYFERPSRRSSTVRNYAEPQGQAHYPPPPPPPPPPPQAQPWNENVDRPCQPPIDACFGTRLAEAQNPPSHQRPTILVIVVNNKNPAGAALKNGYKPVSCQVDYREPANQMSVYQDRCSFNGNNPNRTCGPAENQNYWNFNATYPYQIQEQRIQNGLYDSVGRFDDEECLCSRPNCRRRTGYEQQVPNGSRGQGRRLSFGQNAANGTSGPGCRPSFGQQARNGSTGQDFWLSYEQPAAYGLRERIRRDTYDMEHEARQRRGSSHSGQALRCPVCCPTNNERSSALYGDKGSNRCTGTTIGQGERSFDIAGGKDESFSSITERSVTDPSVTDRSVTDRSVTDRSVADRSVVDRNVTERSTTDQSVACVCDSRCDCDCECALGDLAHTLESLVPNEECLCYLEQLEKAKKAKARKKKQRKSKVVYDRFASPPFVIEPKTFCLGCCNRSCCHSCYGHCCNSYYPWGLTR